MQSLWASFDICTNWRIKKKSLSGPEILDAKRLKKVRLAINNSNRFDLKTLHIKDK